MFALPKTTIAACVAAAVIGVAPHTVQAQDAAQEVCTAEVSPAAVQAGQAAVQVTLTVQGEVGPITAIEGQESGITLADPMALPRTEMAAESAPELIAMSGENVWQLWINTEQATEGEHAFELTGAEGSCTATVTIQPAG